VHAWTTWNAPLPAPQDEAMPYAKELKTLAAREERLLSEALAGHQETYPGVSVNHKVVHGGTDTGDADRGRPNGSTAGGRCAQDAAVSPDSCSDR